MLQHCLLLLALVCAPLCAQQGLPSRVEGEHIRVTLLAEQQGLSKGTNWVGVLFEPEPGWHTYWQNPGDSGEPPALDWSLPVSIQAGDIQWPLPQAIPVAHLTNYGYEGDVLLMVPLEVLPVTAGQRLQVDVSVSWLVCKEDCIPGWADLSLDLPFQSSAEPSDDAALFEQTRLRLPQSDYLDGQFELTGSHIALSVDLPLEELNRSWHAFPLETSVAATSPTQQRMVEDDALLIVLPKSDYMAGAPKELSFLLHDGQTGYYLTAGANPLLSEVANGVAAAPPSLWSLILMALAGGLLLNVMPCVLPVLAIKALQFKQEDNGVFQGVAYLLGVLSTFMLFALIILQVKTMGAQVGWGFHLQNPIVVGLLAVLFLTIALNLFDLGPSGAGLMSLGQSLTQGNNWINAFFTGALAVVVASPCTAPFMATALGVALVSDTLTLFTIFAALGLGFALPMALLSASSRLSAWLPTPGPWMVGLRQFLAFPMLGAMLWLLWVYGQLTSPHALFMMMFALLIFSTLMWSWNRVKSFSRVFLVVAGFMVLSHPLRMASVPPSHSLAREPGNEVTVLSGSDFNKNIIATLRQQHPVLFVNVTADWCITCKVNEQIAFASDDVQQLLGQEGIHYVEVDWTRKEPSILAYLQDYNRVGVPLYLIYSGEKAPRVLPQILTPDVVVQGIQQAQQESIHAAL